MMAFILQDGRGLLHQASYGGHLEVVKLLIEAGADVDELDDVNMQCL